MYTGNESSAVESGPFSIESKSSPEDDDEGAMSVKVVGVIGVVLIVLIATIFIGVGRTDRKRAADEGHDMVKRKETEAIQVLKESAEAEPGMTMMM